MIDCKSHGLTSGLSLRKGHIQCLLLIRMPLVVVQLVVELGQGPLAVTGYAVQDGTDAP